MLSIRLARVGRENLQTFRLVAQEKTTSPKRGKIVESLGFYNPTHPENQLTFDEEKVKKLIGNGAEASDTVARLLIKNGFDKALVEKFVKKYKKQKSKKASEEEAKTPPPSSEAQASTPSEGEENKEASQEGEATPPSEDAKQEDPKPQEETPPPSEEDNSNQANEGDDEAKKE